jgi:hypothetical protein
MSYSASYLTGSGATADYVLGDHVPESSRRARGFAVWAALLEQGVQQEGTCWVGGTTWRGQRLIRVFVSNATTTEHDIDISADAILAAARTT